MKPASPTKTPFAPSRADSASPLPAWSPRSASRQDSLDSQDDLSTGRRTPSPTRPGPGLRVPKAQVPMVRTISGAQAQIASALKEGSVGKLHAVLEQAAKRHRLPAVLGGGEGGPVYARLLDHLHAMPAESEIHTLVPSFGADLLQAALEGEDMPRFTAACKLFAGQHPEQLEHAEQLARLVGQDSGRVFQSAALQPRAMEVLLRHLPSKHWTALLSERGGVALVYLWRNAVNPRGAISEEARTRAFAPLLRIFAEADVAVLNGLHHSNTQVQRHMLAGKRRLPQFLQLLATRLEERGGVVPWGTP